MKNNGKNVIGGFVAVNTGVITNSFSNIDINTKSSLATFCYQNSGKIKKSFSKGIARKNDRAKFCVQNNGSISDYFWYSKAKEKFLSDYNESLNGNELSPKLLKENYSWNFSNLWKNVNSLDDMQFDMNIFFEKRENNQNVIIISNDKELIDFATNVNLGKQEYKNANVVLTKDINLKGKKWTPIGTSENCAFTGTFDGQGHTVENFKIGNKEYGYAGFFGYLKNAQIFNLHVDCVVKGERYVGALAGYNDGGVIFSCYATCKIYEGLFTGGLVGKNTGEIHKCFVEGKICVAIVILPILIALIILLLILLLLYKTFFPKTDDVFKPVVIDPNVVKDPNKDEVTVSANENKASFDFSQVITVDSATMTGSFDFRNPTRGNHDIVVHVLISDKELKEKIGSTGRDNSEQNKIEKKEGYDPSTQMTELYKSGLIKRGYILPVIKISDLPDGTKLPAGTYEAIVKLEFYNSETNEKAIMTSNLPVELIIQ